jgi:hypothetical protein
VAFNLPFPRLDKIGSEETEDNCGSKFDVVQQNVAQGVCCRFAIVELLPYCSRCDLGKDSLGDDACAVVLFIRQTLKNSPLDQIADIFNSISGDTNSLEMMQRLAPEDCTMPRAKE